KPADRRSDIWAFGCVLYEMLTGKRAFEGEDVSDTLANVLKGQPDWNALPQQTRAPIRRLLGRCLERDRKKRLFDIGDARLDIDEAIAGSPPADAAVTPIASLTRERILWASAVVMLVLSSAAAVFWTRRPAPPEMRVEITTPATSDPLS